MLFYPSPLFTRPCHPPLYEQATLSTLFVHVISRYISGRERGENRIMEAHRANRWIRILCSLIFLLVSLFLFSFFFSSSVSSHFTIRVLYMSMSLDAVVRDLFLVDVIIVVLACCLANNNRRSTTVCEPRAHTHKSLYVVYTCLRHSESFLFIHLTKIRFSLSVKFSILLVLYVRSQDYPTRCFAQWECCCGNFQRSSELSQILHVIPTDPPTHPPTPPGLILFFPQK